MDINLVKQLREANIFTPVPEEEVSVRQREEELKYYSPEIIAIKDKVMANPTVFQKSIGWYKQWKASQGNFTYHYDNVFGRPNTASNLILQLIVDSDVKTYEEYLVALNNS